MIRIRVKSGYDGATYQIDAVDRETAATWLLAIALKYGPSQGGVYAPMTIEQCAEVKKVP